MIELTENAIAKLNGALDPTDYVRIAVISGGCSGFSYDISIEEKEETKDDDIIAEFGSVKVYMDPYSHFILRETVVDYVETLQQSGFKFVNSKAAKSCACGTSFKPEDSAQDFENAPSACSTSNCGS